MCESEKDQAQSHKVQNISSGKDRSSTQVEERSEELGGNSEYETERSHTLSNLK